MVTLWNTRLVEGLEVTHDGRSRTEGLRFVPPKTGRKRVPTDRSTQPCYIVVSLVF